MRYIQACYGQSNSVVPKKLKMIPPINDVPAAISKTIVQLLLVFFNINPVKYTPTMPGILPIVFAIAKRIPACFGEMSIIAAAQPATKHPLIPTIHIMKITAIILEGCECPSNIANKAMITKPRVVNIFLTRVLCRIFLLIRKSAILPAATETQI